MTRDSGGQDYLEPWAKLLSRPQPIGEYNGLDVCSAADDPYTFYDKKEKDPDNYITHAFWLARDNSDQLTDSWEGYVKRDGEFTYRSTILSASPGATAVFTAIRNLDVTTPKQAHADTRQLQNPAQVQGYFVDLSVYSGESHHDHDEHLQLVIKTPHRDPKDNIVLMEKICHELVKDLAPDLSEVHEDDLAAPYQTPQEIVAEVMLQFDVPYTLVSDTTID